MNTYSKQSFYETSGLGPMRARSGEVDYGVMWKHIAPHPSYRVSWIRDTGEVYAMTQVREPLYFVYGIVPTRAEVEHVLEGWADHCDEPDGISWVKQQVENYMAVAVLVGRTPAPPVRCANCGGELQATVIRKTHWTFRSGDYDLGTGAYVNSKVYAAPAFDYEPNGWDAPDIELYCASDCPESKLGLSSITSEALVAIVRAAESAKVAAR